MIIKPTPKRTKERDDKPNAQVPFDRLKTVVRRLPPNLPEDIFWGSVQQWVTEETVTWKVYYPGKLRVKANKESVPSRAYIAFKNEQQLAQFSKDYDGHLFRDKAGNESHAVVEFSPYQKVPGDKKKQDARTGTIEKDEDYISFLASLQEAQDAEPPTMEALLASTQPVAQPKTTPLLEALKAERAATKDRESIIRSHAHYRDQGGKKEDGKVKGSASTKSLQASKHTPKKGGANQANTSAATPQARQKEITILPKQPAANPPKQPKSGKNPRPPPANQAKASPAVPAAASAPVAAAAGSGPSSAPAPAAPSKRGRPMIGLGRQFEAALNGAGVKARPTRAKDEEASKDGDTVKTANHTSPKRDRVLKQPVAALPMDQPTKPPVGRGAGESGSVRGGPRGRGRGRGSGFRGS